jgi:hypothetical protein
MISRILGLSEVRHEPRASEGTMEFRLVYNGPLSSASNSSRVKEKHAIRKAVHSQLRELRLIRDSVPNVQRILSSPQKLKGFSFFPLVTSKHACYCDLDILFLRHGNPGSIRVNGDIDNRLKTLYDALRMPKNENELPTDAAPDEDDKPFYCLLEDDSLITGTDIVTDRLLLPSSIGPNEVRLVIHVHIAPMVKSADNLGF